MKTIVLIALSIMLIKCTNEPTINIGEKWVGADSIDPFKPVTYDTLTILDKKDDMFNVAVAIAGCKDTQTWSKKEILLNHKKITN